jgi:GrpB-like predicted nucleotidyltransferase (UPF0157 family)
MPNTIFNKYVFRKYDKRYPAWFLLEKRRLQRVIPHASRIEHIGSTAVPGLGGKGIVDIHIAVTKGAMLRTKNKLIKAGYDFRPKGGNASRHFFQKDYSHNGSIRRVHVHLSPLGSFEWNQTIALRDALRENPRLARQYATIKRRAVKIAKGEMKKYKKTKQLFFDALKKTYH